MMEKKRVLYVNQEIMPYLPETPMSKIGRYLPQKTQERNKEIRTFMPRYGVINERRNQLHEVIRLSGMNLIIDDIDHPLIIKVASIQQARMQVYFIDNEDYFKRKFMFKDKDDLFFNDNDERAIFFSKGVLETVKKLGWVPDVIHCHGWFSSLVPLFVRTAYKDSPIFQEARIIFSLYNDDFSERFRKGYEQKVIMSGLSKDDFGQFLNGDYVSLMKGAIDRSDALILGSPEINAEILAYAKTSGKPILDFIDNEDYFDTYNEFYDKIIEGN
ncbi:MAG: glycogen/starch synthase [Bacteroidales bacterium]|nr:glycogen/starch synthase [Bacteroidales bacterium]